MKKGLVFLLFIYFAWQFLAKMPDKSVYLIACDVGQGDAILIQQGFFQVLIDAGPDDSVTSCLEKYLPFTDKKIDVLVLTHYDSDHIGGFAAIAKQYQFANIFAPLSDYKESEVFLELNELFSQMIMKGTRVKQPILGQQIAYRDSSLEDSAPSILFTFLTPAFLEYDFLENINFFQAESRLPETLLSADNPKNLANSSSTESTNDRSIALLMEYGQLRVFLSGDLEEGGELSILQSALIDRVDILKVAHHGSKTSSSGVFLSQVLPELAIISVGKNNKFNHPSPEVLDNFQAISSQIVRTDQNGDVKIKLFKDHFCLLDKKNNFL